MSPRPTLAALMCAGAMALATGTSAQVPSPSIEGPITNPGTPFVAATTFDLAQVGYEEAEYFISGTARAYVNSAPLGTDGRWSVTTGETAAYKTRILVYRPTNPKKFSGTVVVEWLNVSGGVDAAPDWVQGHVELLRDGVAWVGVSAQIVGVEGGPTLLGLMSQPLKVVNPARYGSLHHPGDSFSYDIFSQAGQAIRTPSGPNPLGTLKAKRVIAIGESQSASRMVNYVNAIHPVAHIYDGFLIHSRGSFGAALSEAPQPAIIPPGSTAIRADVDVPVFTVETETDLTLLGYFRARQDDARHFRLWEVAGTAHYDTYGLGVGTTDVGTSPDIAAVVIMTDAAGGMIHCNTPVNSGPLHYVLNAALNKLIRWVRTGKAPKSAPRLDVSAGPPITIQRDQHGNALGGIRTPWVDVPIATFTGQQSGGSILCLIFGTTTLFDAPTLAALYPTHKAFTSAYDKALKRAVKKGWILEPDAKLIKKWAAGSNIGG
ncbi:MAG TPA: alpha/beta hydrolase domain-containing protein [Gemmatimonadales bacterium]